MTRVKPTPPPCKPYVGELLLFSPEEGGANVVSKVTNIHSEGLVDVKVINGPHAGEVFTGLKKVNDWLCTR